MHSEIFSIASFACADGGPVGGPPPGSSLRHFACAALNAGDDGSIPEFDGIWMPPPPVGSGKFGTPFERMHSANLTNAALLPDEPAEPEAL